MTQHSDATKQAPRIPYIARVILSHFRSYAQADFACGAGIVILTGANGAGKTNILEAISTLGPGRGLRRARFEELARHNQQDDWAVVADIADKGAEGKEVRVGVGGQIGTAGRRLRIDGQAASGFEQLARLLPQLWIAPDMDRLFVDSASGRRRFIDHFAQTLDARLATQKLRWSEAMRTRNRLLAESRDGQAVESAWLDGVEEVMASSGVAIAYARLTALDNLAGALAQATKNGFPKALLALEGTLETELRDQLALSVVEETYQARLASARARDMAAGRTLEGPHRSDLLVRYAEKNMPAKECSTGEQKALLVGLILAQAHSVAARIKTVPILLLDEIAAHLDTIRREALAEALCALGGQCWITGTETRQFAAFQRKAQFFSVAENAIKEACI